MEKKVQKINTTTVGELGPSLPLGVFKDGVWHKNLNFKQWRMKEERELGRLKDENGNMIMAKFVTTVLSSMTKQYGPYNFETMSDGEKMLHISTSRVPDVFYAYILLRIKSLGSNLDINLCCPRCNNEYTFTADLNSMDVETADTIEDATWTYELRDAFEIRGRNVEAINFCPPLWNVLENMKGIGEYNTGEQKAKVILGSVKSLVFTGGVEEQIVMVLDELDEMSKYDIERIYAELNDKGIGPEMVVGSECPKCGKKFEAPIRWLYDDFFAASSR